MKITFGWSAMNLRMSSTWVSGYFWKFHLPKVNARISKPSFLRSGIDVYSRSPFFSRIVLLLVMVGWLTLRVLAIWRSLWREFLMSWKRIWWSRGVSSFICASLEKKR